MLSLFIFCMVNFSLQSFIQELVKYQGIKTKKQVVDDAKLVGSAFSQKKISDVDLVNYLSTCDIFKIKDNNELIASVYLKRTTYFKKVKYLFFTRFERIKAVEIYSLWVNNKYRRKGFARELLYKSLLAIRDEYDYENDFVVGLHLNESDENMNISFALYYSMNFRKGTYVNFGPDDFKYNYEIIHKLHNPIDVVSDIVECHSKGTFFAMYTTFNNILFSNSINKLHFKIGEILRKNLKERKSK